MQVNHYIGDSFTMLVPMSWNGEDLTLGVDWNLIFTAKRSANDLDASAVFQKVIGAGIRVTDNIAEIAVLPDDTSHLLPSSYIWDIQAQNTATGEVRTVAIGGLKLIRDITRKTTTSTTIHTLDPGVPFTGPQGEKGEKGDQGIQGIEGKPAILPDYVFSIIDDYLYVNY